MQTSFESIQALLHSPLASSSWEFLVDLARPEYGLVFSDVAKKQQVASYQQLQQKILSGETFYGTHTHFGAQFCRSANENFSDHQRSLLRYLQVGTGSPLNSSVVRRALRLQLLKIVQGYSGVSPLTFEKLLNLSNQKQLPDVPSQGSLGASGDLIPMAHAIHPIFENHAPAERDVLALVNTNAMMASLAIETLSQFEKFMPSFLQMQSALWQVMQVSLDPLQLLTKQPFCLQHPYQAKVAHQLLGYMHNIPIQKPFVLQSRYSMRCLPQILGTALRQLEAAKICIEEQSLAISDNPVMVDGQVYHGGLFYASDLAYSSDLLQDVIGRISECVDRQVLLLMDPELNGGLPHNLECDGASHCKGLHQLISSLCQRLRARSAPCRLMSFSCESNNQDVVPCSMEGWNGTYEQLQIFETLLQAANFCVIRAQKIRHGEENIPPLESWRLNRFAHGDLP